MVPNLTTGADLSLQHVIENSLAIVENEAFEEQKRTEILTNLTSLLDQASRGSKVLQSNSLVLDADQQPAIDRFTMLFHYLQPLAQDVPAFLDKARVDLEGLRDHKADNPEKRKEVTEILKLLLQAVLMDRCLKPLIAPREYIFS